MAFFPFHRTYNKYLLALIQLWLFLVGTIHSAEEEEAVIDYEDKENYLYYGDPEATAYVNDYHPDPNQDRGGAHSPTLYTPSFLFGPNNPPRVVEFYAPWCPHCQHFRNHYVQFAKQLRILGEENGVAIDVHAVSCQAFRPLCQHFGVHGYPRLLIFKAGEHNSSGSLNYWDIHPFDVLRELNIQVDQLPVTVPEDQEDNKNKNNNKKNNKAGGNAKSQAQHHLSSATSRLYPRTKQNVFDDARSSLFFALQTGIFTKSNEALNNQTSDALYDWLELLHYSLPPTWNVQQMVTAVLEGYPNITFSENALLHVVNRYTPSSDASSGAKKATWSSSCSKGNIHMGYTCGLWQLFHIITVGVVEWNLMIQSDDGSRIVDTASSALTIRNFVEHFFGCDVCRLNFVNAYDSCFLNRCHRLIPDETLESWIQLPVWLWEMHNAVNVRLLKEKYEREYHGRIPTLEEEHAVQWPSRKECPRCWSDEGGWDDMIIYKFLRVEYWYIDSLWILVCIKH